MPLPTELRNRLASVIKDARREGEAGATRSLQGLAVDRHEPHGSMSLEERRLRNRLRAHGRQLGDTRDRRRGTQEIKRLSHEVSYEHWHRMLFARFLAENNLLVEPESSVAISMAECEDLAREHGEDPWVLAGRYAQRMLPRIFRPDDPALAVALAPETRQALERLLESLPVEIFTSDDALGWTYQFWQAERKDEVNASGVKIGAEELPAVTQLFTEHYMVLFLFHNTIGAWHAGKILEEQPELATNAASEEELRRAVRLRAAGGYDFSYLRFVREANEGDESDAPTGPWRPAAGTFERWPRTAAELRVLDPCCGSGHFLVEGFELLVRLRMEEESLALEDAIRAVLADNLHGLEIDPRCTQIAAFNLALAAWRRAGRSVELPPLNIACSGLAPNATTDQWLTLAEQAASAGGMPADRDLFGAKDTLLSSRVRGALSALYELFQQAPELGSLIDPRALEGNLLRADFAMVQPLLQAALEGERSDAEGAELAVAAYGMARAAGILAAEYTIVATNVPYLGFKKQASAMREYGETVLTDGKANIGTMFIQRINRILSDGGTAACVTPTNWLLQASYRRLREALLTSSTWNLVARLGTGAFETVSGEVVNATLVVLSNVSRPNISAETALLDVRSGSGIASKAELLARGPLQNRRQDSLPHGSDNRITINAISSTTTVGDYAIAPRGIVNGDDPRWTRLMWEVPAIPPGWRLLQSAPGFTTAYGGRARVIDWSTEGEGMLRPGRSNLAYGRLGIAVSRMSTLPAALFSGDLYDQSCAVIVPESPVDIPALWAFASSETFAQKTSELDENLNVTPGTLLRVGFDRAHWRRVAAGQYSGGLPEPRSDDPTQWLFHGHPATSNPAEALQIAVVRLLGYRWPPEVNSWIPLSEDAQAWGVRANELLEWADEDGIVCLTAIRGEVGAADRLRRLLAAAFGSEWSGVKERELLSAAAGGTRPAASLQDWLRDSFFEEHCKLFQHRPFVWHIWDGQRDGFHALVNYHRLAAPGGEGRRTLEALTYSYLGDWIQRQEAERHAGREGADGRLAAALELQSQLERIRAGEPPFDIFVRWKPLHEQPIGWEPDIKDGVRLNIRPFMNAELRTGGRRGAGILRWKPNIGWKKDRGTDPASLRSREDFPWLWRCPGAGSAGERTDFAGGADCDGIRWNDLHHTSAAKQAAREQASRQMPG